jgi:hypothetical protein
MSAALRPLGASLLLASILFHSGCASDRAAQAPSQVTPETAQQVLRNPAAKTRLSSYPQAQLRAVAVADGPHDRAEDELARKIDDRLHTELRRLWRDLVHVPRSVPFTTPAEGTLLIEPTIVETKLTTRFEREVFTWGMGDTYVLVKVVFRDGATGEPIAEPVFYRKADLFWASWSSGADDVEVERLVAGDVITYTRDNF